MPSVPTNDNGSKSGIITSETGERHIPPSVRPDGTQRREIKIRPGYRPPEDVEVYKNRTAESWKSRGSGGVPGAADKDDEDAGMTSRSSNKNAKRREARKRAKAADERIDHEEDEYVRADTMALAAVSSETGGERDEASDPLLAKDVAEESQAEKEKLVRSLKKKLRQARELKEKKDKGDGLLPEQFEKVIKINELIRQLDSLGFHGDGEPKEGT